VLRIAIRGDVDVLCSLEAHLRRDDLASVYEHYHFNVMTMSSCAGSCVAAHRASPCPLIDFYYCQ
jgi:hypothetical protein